MINIAKLNDKKQSEAEDEDANAGNANKEENEEEENPNEKGVPVATFRESCLVFKDKHEIV